MSFYHFLTNNFNIRYSTLLIPPPIILQTPIPKHIPHLLAKRHIPNNVSNLIPQRQCISFLLHKESLPRRLQESNWHPLRLTQMLLIRHFLIILISIHIRKILPVRPGIKEFLPTLQYLFIRNRKPDISVIIKAVKDRHLIHFLHLCSFDGLNEFSSDSCI